MDQELKKQEEALINEEEQYANELAINQEHYQAEQQLIDFHNEGIKYGHPSYIKYGIVFLLGLIIESTDFLDLIGVGVLVSKPVALLITFIIFLIFWLTNTKQKKADHYVSEAEKIVAAIATNLAHIERRAFQTAKLARRFGATRFAARIRISSRLVRRNPLFKFAAAGVANLIPYLAVFPWVLFGIYLSYRDEKKSLQNARETAGEIAEQIPELQINTSQFQTKISQESQVSPIHIQQGASAPNPLGSTDGRKEKEYSMGTDEASQKNIKEQTDWAFPKKE